MDVDNNACEQFNSVINKFLGGKRINFTQKNSYSTRVQAAVVSFNSGEYLRTVKKFVTHKSPGILLYLIKINYKVIIYFYSFIGNTNIYLLYVMYFS